MSQAPSVSSPKFLCMLIYSGDVAHTQRLKLHLGSGGPMMRLAMIDNYSLETWVCHIFRRNAKCHHFMTQVQYNFNGKWRRRNEKVICVTAASRVTFFSKHFKRRHILRRHAFVQIRRGLRFTAHLTHCFCVSQGAAVTSDAMDLRVGHLSTHGSSHKNNIGCIFTRRGRASSPRCRIIRPLMNWASSHASL